MLQSERMILYATTCPICFEKTMHEISYDSWEQLLLPRSERKNIQDIFKDMKPQQREEFITGLCPDCQKVIFR